MSFTRTYVNTIYRVWRNNLHKAVTILLGISASNFGKTKHHPCISAIVPKQDSRYTIGFQPSNANVSDAWLIDDIVLQYNVILQIKASDIAFWDKKFSIMQRKHEKKMYPPRVKMTVSINDSNLTHFVLPVKFVGCRDNELETDLTLPLSIQSCMKKIRYHHHT